MVDGGGFSSDGAGPLDLERAGNDFVRIYTDNDSAAGEKFFQKAKIFSKKMTPDQSVPVAPQSPDDTTVNTKSQSPHWPHATRLTNKIREAVRFGRTTPAKLSCVEGAALTTSATPSEAGGGGSSASTKAPSESDGTGATHSHTSSSSSSTVAFNQSTKSTTTSTKAARTVEVEAVVPDGSRTALNCSSSPATETNDEEEQFNAVWRCRDRLLDHSGYDIYLSRDGSMNELSDTQGGSHSESAAGNTQLIGGPMGGTLRWEQQLRKLAARCGPGGADISGGTGSAERWSAPTVASATGESGAGVVHAPEKTPVVEPQTTALPLSPEKPRPVGSSRSAQVVSAVASGGFRDYSGAAREVASGPGLAGKKNAGPELPKKEVGKLRKESTLPQQNAYFSCRSETDTAAPRPIPRPHASAKPTAVTSYPPLQPHRSQLFQKRSRSGYCADNDISTKPPPPPTTTSALNPWIRRRLERLNRVPADRKFTRAGSQNRSIGFKEDILGYRRTRCTTTLREDNPDNREGSINLSAFDSALSSPAEGICRLRDRGTTVYQPGLRCTKFAQDSTSEASVSDGQCSGGTHETTSSEAEGCLGENENGARAADFRIAPRTALSSCYRQHPLRHLAGPETAMGTLPGREGAAGRLQHNSASKKSPNAPRFRRSAHSGIVGARGRASSPRWSARSDLCSQQHLDQGETRPLLRSASKLNAASAVGLRTTNRRRKDIPSSERPTYNAGHTPRALTREEADEAKRGARATKNERYDADREDNGRKFNCLWRKFHCGQRRKHAADKTTGVGGPQEGRDVLLLVAVSLSTVCALAALLIVLQMALRTGEPEGSSEAESQSLLGEKTLLSTQWGEGVMRISPFKDFKRHLETHICASPQVCAAWEKSAQLSAGGSFQSTTEALRKANYELWKQQRGSSATVDLRYLHDLNRKVGDGGVEHRFMSSSRTSPSQHLSRRWTVRNLQLFSSHAEWQKKADLMFQLSVRFLKENADRVQQQVNLDLQAAGIDVESTSGNKSAAEAVREEETAAEQVAETTNAGGGFLQKRSAPGSSTRRSYKRVLLVGCVPIRFDTNSNEVRIAFVKAKHTEAPELPKGKVQDSALNNLENKDRLHENDFAFGPSDWPRLREEALRELAEETGLRLDDGDFSLPGKEISTSGGGAGDDADADEERGVASSTPPGAVSDDPQQQDEDAFHKVDLLDEAKYFSTPGVEGGRKGSKTDLPDFEFGPDLQNNILQVTKRSVFWPVEVNSIHADNWSNTDFGGGFYRDVKARFSTTGNKLVQGSLTLKASFGLGESLLAEIEKLEKSSEGAEPDGAKEERAAELAQLRNQYADAMKKAANHYRRQIAWIDLNQLPEMLDKLAATPKSMRKQNTFHASSPRNVKAILELLPWIENRYGEKWTKSKNLGERLGATLKKLEALDDVEKGRGGGEGGGVVLEKRKEEGSKAFLQEKGGAGNA